MADFPNSSHLMVHDICKVCVVRYLDQKVQYDKLKTICPADCDAELGYEEYKAWASRRTFMR